MSIWTHLNGHIRIDSIGDAGYPKRPSNEDAFKGEVEALLGRIVRYEDESFDTTAPLGSEGSAEYRVYRAPRGYNIGLWADLRDFGEDPKDLEKIEDWLKKLLDHQFTTILGFVREAVFHIDREFGTKYVLLLREKELIRLEVPSKEEEE